MLREIITPRESVITMRLPNELIGKTVEIIAFEIMSGRPTSTISRQQKIEKIEKLTGSSLVDLSNFKFDRNDANDYDA